jgi:hypothetical protein
MIQNVALVEDLFPMINIVLIKINFIQFNLICYN